MITKGAEDLPIIKQCKILSISRSCVYYKPKEPDKTSEKALIKEIRNIYDEACFYGHIKVWKELERRGYNVGQKKVRKLREELELKAVCPTYSRYRHRKCDNKFPYLLDGVIVTRPNQVWQSDITYVPTSEGYAYKTAIIDVFSRKILTYRLTATLQQASCISALAEALEKFPHPEIFNTDQGSQYASENFFKPLLERQIQVSMDGKGRALDNIYIERYWRSYKYENVYLFRYKNIFEAKSRTADYVNFYNSRRLHAALDYKTPNEIYFESLHKSKNYDKFVKLTG
jgi:putative transposase